MGSEKLCPLCHQKDPISIHIGLFMLPISIFCSQMPQGFLYPDIQSPTWHDPIGSFWWQNKHSFSDPIFSSLWRHQRRVEFTQNLRSRKFSCNWSSEDSKRPSHQPKIGLVWEIKQGQSTQAIPCQECTNPSQETLSLNPEICDLTEMANGQSMTLPPLPEMANFKRIYGT